VVAAKKERYGRCKGCQKSFRRPTVTGYCAVCFHTKPGIKRKYGQARWNSGAARERKWRNLGVVFDADDVAAYSSATHCGLCGKAFTKGKVLDHDHDTGHVRGALCRPCNTALGRLGDDLVEVVGRICAYWSQYLKRIARKAGGTN
jgi:hypothetical protein